MSTFDVLFLGTGVSTALPSLFHVMTMENQCQVCKDGWESIFSKNRRNNVSIALLFDHNNDKKCVVIDVGKTMREAMLRYLPSRGISSVNAVMLTHSHADACFGLDDVRDFQKNQLVNVEDPISKEVIVGFKILDGPLPIFLHRESMDVISQTFSYLTSDPPYVNQEEQILSRRVALLDFRVIDYNQTFTIHGLPVRAFPVYHGGTYICLGFVIGKEGEFVYISDVKIIPEDTFSYLKSIPQIKILVLDCLGSKGIYAHVGLDEALDIVTALKPLKTYFVGMGCSLGLHDYAERKIQERNPDVYLAYDGLCLEGLEK